MLRKAFFLSALFFLALLFSCKKDGELSPDFDNGNLAMIFVDTFSLVSSVVQEDSIRTDGLIYNAVGLYNDPIFGPVSSSIYTQVVLNGSNVNFGTAPILDSAVLTLDYNKLYGDTANPMTIKVYEINEEMDKGNDYYSNTAVSYDPTELASATFTPNITDSVDIAFDGTRKKAHLRVPLSAIFGQKLLGADTLTELNNNTSFFKFMNGLYITSSETVSNNSLGPNGGAFAFFDMNSSLSTLTLYYNDSLSYDFAINTDGEKYARFDHNYSGTEIEKHLNNDALKDPTRTYVSSLAGVKTKIELPTIKDLVKDGPVTISKAEIIFTAVNVTATTYDPIDETLILAGIDASGNEIGLLDLDEGADHFGGEYESSTNSYTFNITRHLHQLLTNNSPDYGMYLISNLRTIEANRVVLNSGESPNYKIRLEITYSKI